MSHNLFKNLFFSIFFLSRIALLAGSMTADFLHGTVSPDMLEDVQSNLEVIL